MRDAEAGQAARGRNVLSGVVAVVPVHARPRIEEHADDRKPTMNGCTAQHAMAHAKQPTTLGMRLQPGLRTVSVLRFPV